MTLPKYEASRNKIYYRYKYRSKQRGIEFTLSKEQFIRVCQNSCHYCGASPTADDSDHNRLNGKWKHNGLDRIDNTKGYLLSNIQACCFSCNKLKSNRDEKDFLSKIAQISIHLGLVGIMDETD